MMDDDSQSEATPNLEGPEVLYVQGVSNPGAVGQYPPTQAIAALILGILGLMGFTVAACLPPGRILAKSAMEIPNNIPGIQTMVWQRRRSYLDWISIILTIVVSVALCRIYCVNNRSFRGRKRLIIS